MLNGKLTHRRTINSKYGTSDIEWLRKRIDPSATRYEGKPKLKYLLPLDDDIAERIKSLSKDYPNTRATSETSDTPGVHPGEGRAARTVALQPLAAEFELMENTVQSWRFLASLKSPR